MKCSITANKCINEPEKILVDIKILTQNEKSNK